MENKKTHFLLNSQTGFTLIEEVLAWAVVGIIALTFAYLLRSGVDSFAMISSRNEALSQARHAAERVTRELLWIKTSDIFSVSPTTFQFRDNTGNFTDFHSQVEGSETKLYRGTDLLAAGLNSFNFTYFDAAGNVISDYLNLAAVRRIQVDLSVTANNGYGTVGVRGEVYPRNFLYTNYQ